MDTHAAILRLQTHGLTLEQAEDITAVIQEATAHTPPPDLRQRLGLPPDPWRTSPHDESQILARCEAILALLARLQGQLDVQTTRFTALEGCLTTPTCLAWAMVGLAGAMVLLTIAGAVWR